jgi:glyoxylase-like metal-dependent hydrolase (beta-lactamase superfamily II)
MPSFAHRLGVVVGLLLGAACAPPTPEEQFVNDLATALGGRDRVTAARVWSAEGEATQYNLGQDMRPGAATQTFSVAGYTRHIDLGALRVSVAMVRTPNFPYFQGQAPQRQAFGIDGETVYTVNAAGTAARAAGQAAIDRRIDAFSHPLPLARAVLGGSARVANVRTTGDERQADLTLSGVTFTLVLDGSGAPVRVETKTDHANLGDVTVSTAFADYQDVGGLRLPARLTTRVDDFTTTELRLAKQALDGDPPPAAPDLPAQPAPSTAPALNVTVEPVAKGLWLLAGGSHHSVLVEFADHLVLIEAPQSEARTAAVIAKARETVPGKTLTHLVTTHHHFDHTAGLRTAIAEGLTVVTQAGNQAFVEEMAKRPHTIRPDALAKNPRPVAVDAVDEEQVTKDAVMTMELYHVAGNPHSDTMLMAYFPAARVVVEVDAFSPGAAVHPYAANLLQRIKTRNLRVDRIVPLHSTIAPFDALVKAAAGT